MPDPSIARLRREPPRFCLAEVTTIDDRSPHLRAVRLTGSELVGFGATQPAASVRLLLPSPGDDGLVLPRWNGNEFLRPDGSRPVIRTLTPRRGDPEAGTLDLEVVLHDDGPLSAWARTAAPGDPVAVSGPGRAYEIDAHAAVFLLAGDDSAIPALSMLLEALPPRAAIDVIVEVAHPDGRVELPHHPGATVQWLDQPPGSPHGAAMVAAVEAAALPEGVRVWVAGEAAAVQRIRRHLFDERGLDRSQVVARGYWKHGRRGDADSSEG